MNFYETNSLSPDLNELFKSVSKHFFKIYSRRKIYKINICHEEL